MCIVRTDEFRKDAVWIALTSVLSRKQIADYLCTCRGFVPVRYLYLAALSSKATADFQPFNPLAYNEPRSADNPHH